MRATHHSDKRQSMSETQLPEAFPLQGLKPEGCSPRFQRCNSKKQRPQQKMQGRITHQIFARSRGSNDQSRIPFTVVYSLHEQVSQCPAMDACKRIEESSTSCKCAQFFFPTYSTALTTVSEQLLRGGADLSLVIIRALKFPCAILKRA